MGRKDDQLATPKKGAVKIPKVGKKTPKQLNLSTKTASLINTSTMDCSLSILSASSGEASTTLLGNGCQLGPSADDNNIAPLNVDSQQNDDELGRKRLKLDEDKASSANAHVSKSNPTLKSDGDDVGDPGSSAAPHTSKSPNQQSPPGGGGGGGGSFMAGSLILSNSILDEVLNEKKMSLLQSSVVLEFLQLARMKKNPMDEDLSKD